MGECKPLEGGTHEKHYYKVPSLPRFRAVSQYATPEEQAKQGLTLVHFSPQPKPFWSTSHLLVSPCLIDRGESMHPTYPTNCAYVEPTPFWSHLLVYPCLTDLGEIIHPTYPTKCAYVVSPV